jgi:hypothetical protein
MRQTLQVLHYPSQRMDPVPVQFAMPSSDNDCIRMKAAPTIEYATDYLSVIRPARGWPLAGLEVCDLALPRWLPRAEPCGRHLPARGLDKWPNVMK